MNFNETYFLLHWDQKFTSTLLRLCQSDAWKQQAVQSEYSLQNAMKQFWLAWFLSRIPNINFSRKVWYVDLPAIGDLCDLIWDNNTNNKHLLHKIEHEIGCVRKLKLDLFSSLHIRTMEHKSLSVLSQGIPLHPLPAKRLQRDASVPHAPVLNPKLSENEFKVRLFSYFFMIHHTFYLQDSFSPPQWMNKTSNNCWWLTGGAPSTWNNILSFQI